MITHPLLSVLIISKGTSSPLHPLIYYFQRIPSLSLSISPGLPQDLSPFQVIVAADSENFIDPFDRLKRYIQAGGGWLGLINNVADRHLPEIFGVQPTPAGPVTELRVAFQNPDHPLARRLPDPIYLNSRYQGLDLTAEDTETILYADWRYSRIPMLTRRQVGNGQIACTTLAVYDDLNLQQIFFRLLQGLAGRQVRNEFLGVGLLGYSPNVGQKHGLGVMATPGLQLRGLCDLNQKRLRQAEEDFPGIKTYPSVENFARSADIDLVIICTPPNTHARLSMEMMAAGKHVLSEKPLALNKKEADSMVEMADREKVHLSCCQNRRWDADYLAIKQAVAEGMIGELFYVETFVGGFTHPCGFWHSHNEISGGTSYDWGGHYLDWMVSLIPDRVESVIGTRHKRVWHDITNADQERVQIRFTGGQEAEFIHSDICAIRKPKWYLLGTEGAIIGQWRDVTCYQPDPVLYFREHDIPATEILPELSLHRRTPSGPVIVQKLAAPKFQDYALYRNLADHLLTGEPIVAPVEQSVLVVAILEAAARSAARKGSVEVLDG